MKTISILGSTGSIGKSVLEVISHYSEEFQVIGLTTRRNFQIIQRQIKKFNPKIVGIVDPVTAEKVKRNFPSLKIEVGEEGIVRVAKEKVDILVVAIVGIAALKPTLAAIQHNHTIALANKEIIVASGKLFMEEVKKRKIQILPLDSEPCAIFQVYKNIKRDDVKRVIITASGGPFYNLKEKELWEVTPEMALKHPVWQMGQKITIDSATLMNKGFEIITIHWLFDLQMEEIQVVIHPEAKIHAMVELKDGFTFSLLSPPDMKYV
ncbi:1-deoxy-D-xylulose-5-phosphate reductoisomerase, partial [Candidatus Calescamantes bacterium]|nr:1-deoxy-D-xylulose-5-phosphate reductoisomerase [Candidatus Calescamantes bacterium]